jgi:hypothetical protein
MSNEISMQDMPKLESPFVRKMVNGDYVVIDEVQEGYEWVFEDDEVMAVEKLDGTNVSVKVKDGKILEAWNREHYVPFYSQNNGHHYIIKGILNSIAKGYTDKLVEGQYFGELVGPKINGNPYNLDRHLWIPFRTYSHRKLTYHSWGKYPKTFEAISKWFKNGPFSIFYAKRHGLSYSDPEVIFAEGIVFTHPDGRMAKLRRDMFEWYEGKRHKMEGVIKCPH